MTPSLILRLDVSGQPVTWLPWEEAVTLYCREKVAWTTGDSVFTFRGGICRNTGKRSFVAVSSIIAIKRSYKSKYTPTAIPPLNNRELFFRDGNLCMYCGDKFPDSLLTRDHVIPVSRRGKNRWSNVVAACRACNTRKGSNTPEEARMPLLAVPYVPNWAEYLAISNRRILADQMDFLKTQFKQRDRILGGL